MHTEQDQHRQERDHRAGMFKNEEHITNMVQIATSLALVLGLILVLWELQQAKYLTLAELSSEGYSEALEISRVILGEESAAVFARACFNPGELTPTEVVILDQYFDARILMIDRLRTLEAVAEFGVSWQAYVDPFIDEIFGSDYGRWYLSNNPPPNPETRRLVEAVAETRDCADYYGRFSSLQD